MAWTAPRTWTTGELVTAAIMNTHVRDNELFLVARGLYDGFNRADSTTLGNANSGHAWTENAGNQEIVGNALRGVSNGICTLDSGLELVTMHASGIFTAGSVAANVDFAIVLRFIDTSNFLYIELTGTLFQLVKMIAGTPTALASQAFTPVASTTYRIDCWVRGPIVTARLENAVFVPQTAVYYQTIADTETPFAGATKTGLRMFNSGGSGDLCLGFTLMPNA